MSVEEAREHIERDYMLRLGEAPFDTTDATLVPKAGACSACPKRTGAQRELFSDVKSADLCTDPPCFKTKVDALWQIRKKEAEKGGKKVLEGKAAQAALSHGGSHVSLDHEEWVGEKHVKVRKLFGKDLPETTLARDHNGNVLELVPRADFQKVLRKKMPKQALEEERAGGDAYRARMKREEKKQKIRRKAIRAAIGEAVGKVTKAQIPEVFDLVVQAFAARSWNEVQRDVLERRGITPKLGDIEKQILKMAKGLKSDTEIAGLGLELALRSGAPWHSYGNGAGGGRELWTEGLKLVGVNFEKLERAAQAEAKGAKGKPKAALVHLYRENGTNGTACGGRAGAKDGAGTVKTMKGVTCENCKRVGPSVLASEGRAKRSMGKR
jgi:hypothetical protein